MLGFTTLLFLTNNDIEHASLPTQTSEVKGFQIETHLHLFSQKPIDSLKQHLLSIFMKTD